MRTIIATFKIEDNDLIEQKLFDSLQCESLTDYKKLPDTKDLYDNDKHFVNLCKQVKDAKRIRDNYINQKK